MANSFRSMIPKKIFWKHRPCRRCGEYFRTAGKNCRLCEKCLKESSEKAKIKCKTKKPMIETIHKKKLALLKEELFGNG